MEPATGAEIEHPKKRVAPNGNRLPDPIREGEILVDITKNQWKLGRSIGVGGFGEIYLGKLMTKFSDEVGVMLWPFLIFFLNESLKCCEVHKELDFITMKLCYTVLVC
jgi:hypothetical protein